MSITFSYVPLPASNRLAFDAWFYSQFALRKDLGPFHEAFNDVRPAKATLTLTLNNDLHTPQLLDLLLKFSTSRDFFLSRPPKSFESFALKSAAVAAWEQQYCELYHLLMPSVKGLKSDVHALLDADFALTGRKKLVTWSRGLEGGIPGPVEKQQLAKLALIDRMDGAFYRSFSNWKDLKSQVQVELAAEKYEPKLAPASGIQDRFLALIGVKSPTTVSIPPRTENYRFPAQSSLPRPVDFEAIVEHPSQPWNGMSGQGISESNIRTHVSSNICFL